MRGVLLSFVALGLASCGPGSIGERTVKDRAKYTVNTVVEQKMPGIDASPITDCIIDAASGEEIIRLASDSATGVTTETIRQVFTIAGRPESVNCMAANSQKLFTG